VADGVDHLAGVQLLLGDGVGPHQRLALARAQLADGLGQQAVGGGEVDVLHGPVGAVLDQEGHGDVAGGDHHGGLGGVVDEQRRLGRVLRQGACQGHRPQRQQRPRKGRRPPPYCHPVNHFARNLSSSHRRRARAQTTNSIVFHFARICQGKNGPSARPCRRKAAILLR